MKLLTNNLKTIRDALLASVGTGEEPAVYHYQRPAREDLKRYVIWAEDGEADSQMVNNHKAQQQIRGTVDLYTAAEFDPWADRIQEQLDTAPGVTWTLESVQYEDATGLIHFEWTFTVI